MFRPFLLRIRDRLRHLDFLRIRLLMVLSCLSLILTQGAGILLLLLSLLLQTFVEVVRLVFLCDFERVLWWKHFIWISADECFDMLLLL